MQPQETPGEGIRRLRHQIQTVDRPKSMITSPDQTSVSIDWEELRNSEGEATVPVAPFVLCKTVVEDEQGGLFLNGTIIQVRRSPSMLITMFREVLGGLPAK